MGGYLSAKEIVQNRFNAKQWALYKHTPHRSEVKSGDKLLIYLAGSKEMSFSAIAEANSIVDSKGYIGDGEHALSNSPYSMIILENSSWLPKKVNIKEILDNLEFIPKNNPRWGCVLQRGVKKISEKDYNFIVDRAHLEK